MTDLKKLLVIVKSSNCKNFTDKYYLGQETIHDPRVAGDPILWSGTPGTEPTEADCDPGYALGHSFTVKVGEVTTHYYAQRSTEYDKRVVFLESTQEIFTQGQLYGGGADLTEIKKILGSYGKYGNRATTVAADIDAVLTAITNTQLAYISYNSVTGGYTAYTYLNSYIDNNPTASHDLLLRGWDGGAYTTLSTVNVADSASDFTAANSYWLTDVFGVVDYVKNEIGSLSGGMRYNGNTYTDSKTVGATTYTIGYFPWNEATKSVKPGDTAIANDDFVVLDSKNEVYKTIETGDILIGKYQHEIKQNTVVNIKTNEAACTEKNDGYVITPAESTPITIKYIIAFNSENNPVWVEYDLRDGEEIISDKATIWTNPHGILIDEYALDYITVIERETDDMVTATVAFETGQKITYTTGPGYNIAESAYSLGYDEHHEAQDHTMATEKWTYSYVASKVNTLEVAETTVEAKVGGTTYSHFTYEQHNGLVTVNNFNITVNDATWNESTHTLSYNGDSYGFITYQSNIALNSYIAYIGSKLDNFDETITTVAGEKVALGDRPASYYIAVRDTTTDTNDHNYTVYAYLLQLGDAVGLRYENGEWVPGPGNITGDGLASAYDVAYEIVNDEKVIAAALNGHETRIKNLEVTSSYVNTYRGVTTYSYVDKGIYKGAETYFTAATVTAEQKDGVWKLTYGTGQDGYVLDTYALWAIGTYAYEVAHSQTSEISTKIVYTYSSEYTGIGLNISYETGKNDSYIYAYFDADHAIAYSVSYEYTEGETKKTGTYTYSVMDVAKVVYDPWETFA